MAIEGTSDIEYRAGGKPLKRLFFELYTHAGPPMIT